jgi:hypothetical protein
LGSGPEDGEEIKCHPFFQGIDWIALENKKVEMPFKPFISNAMNADNFDKEFTEMPTELTPTNSVPQLKDLDISS